MLIYLLKTAKAPRRGLAVVRAQLEADGHTARYVTIGRKHRQTSWDWSDAADAGSVPHPDAWFVSALSHRDWWQLPAITAELPGRSQVVIGGQSADLMARWGDSFCDILATGDFHSPGRHQLYDWIRRRRTGVIDLGWAEIPPPPVRTTQGTVIYLAMGCPRGCPYCRITASRPYVTAPHEDVLRAISAADSRRVSLYSPSGDHPSMGKLLDHTADAGKIAANTDYHPRAALRLLPQLDPAARLRYGIEGMSERLRTQIGRPLSTADLDQITAGRGTHQYYLAGLDGETAADYAELMDAMEGRARRGGSHWYTVTPFKPIPGTAWEGLPGTLDPETYRRIMQLVAHGKRLHAETGSHCIVAQPKSKALHECEVATMRAGASTPRFLVELRTGLLNWKDRAQRWMAAAEAAGLDPDGLLAPYPSRQYE